MNILYASDGSERAVTALAHAARLAQATGAHLVGARVLDPRMDLGSELAVSVKDASSAVARQWTDALRAEAKAAGVEAEPRIVTKRRREDTASAILRAAEDERAAAIVMATRGTGVWRHAFLGSTAMSVLGHSPEPVVLAGAQVQPPRSAATEPYHILVTTDGSEASEAVWPGLRRLFRRAGSHQVRLTLLRVYVPATGDPPDAVGQLHCEWYLAQFRKLAPRRFEAATIVRPIEPLGGVDTAILNVADEIRADAIWMASHGHSSRRHLLAGSVALGVLGRAPVPVTLVRSPK